MTTKKSTKAQRTSERVEKLASKWKSRQEEAAKSQKVVFDKARENYQVYYAQTPEDQKAASPWKSNVFLPLLPGKARDAKAKISILEPRFIVRPADSWTVDDSGEMSFDQNALTKSIKVTKKLNKEFTQYTATGELPPKVSVDYALTDAIVAGWGLALAPLTTYERVYKTKKPLLDENGEPSAYVDDSAVQVKKLLRVGTELEALDIFRVFISPKAKSFERSRYLIIEREETYSDLEAANSKIGERVYDLPAGLENAKGNLAQNDYSAVREEALGYQASGTDRKDDSIEVFNVYDCYDQDEGMFYTFINAKLEGHSGEWHLIREMKNPYNHGLIPIVPFYVKRRPHSPYGESFFEISKDVQFAYNAAFNQFRDNATISGESMALIDKNSIINSYEVGPGAVVEYDSMAGEKPEPWKLNSPDSGVFGAQMEYLEKNAENGTTPQYNSGQVNSSMDKTAGTRGGIEMLMEAANDKLSEMYRNIKGSLLRYGFIALQNAQQYQNYIEVLDSPDLTARSVNPDKAENFKVDYLTPVDLQEAFDLDIDDESLLPLNKSERRRLFQGFVDTMLAFHKASVEQAQVFNEPESIMRLDWQDLAKEIGEQYAELNAPAFVMKPWTREEIAQKKVEDAAIEQEATEAASGVAQDANPDAEVSQDPNGLTVQRQKRELSNFKDYPSDVKNAVLASFGYPESQLIDEQAAAEIAEAKSAQLDVQVKEQMINAANQGVVDPATLAKFIAK